MVEVERIGVAAMKSLKTLVLVFCLNAPALASAQIYDCKWISETDQLTGQQVSQIAQNRYELEVVNRTLKWTITTKNKQKKSLQECINLTIDNETLKCLVESDYTTKDSIFIYLRTKSLYSFEFRSMKLIKLSTIESQTRSDNHRSSIEREITYQCNKR